LVNWLKELAWSVQRKADSEEKREKEVGVRFIEPVSGRINPTPTKTYAISYIILRASY